MTKGKKFFFARLYAVTTLFLMSVKSLWRNVKYILLSNVLGDFLKIWIVPKRLV